MAATLDQLLTNRNLVQDALGKIKSIQKNLTPNPAIDEHIGKAYNELQKAYIKLGAEITTTS